MYFLKIGHFSKYESESGSVKADGYVCEKFKPSWVGRYLRLSKLYAKEYLITSFYIMYYSASLILRRQIARILY